jgi:signal peptidase II
VSFQARALGVGLGVVASDQASKAAITSSLNLGQSERLPLGFHLVRTENSGVAFGFLGGGGALVVVLTVAVLIAVLVWLWRQPGRPGLWLAAGLLAGGAVGNLIDRARLGAVTDFIDPPLWPAFNVADVAITLGVAVLVLVTLAPPAESQ